MSTPTPNQLQLKASDEIMRGVYANLVQMQNSREEFVLDFINAFQPVATLNARVIVSPALAKRLAGMLASAVANYEKQFGPIEASKEQEGIGFRTE